MQKREWPLIEVFKLQEWNSKLDDSQECLCHWHLSVEGLWEERCIDMHHLCETFDKYRIYKTKYLTNICLFATSSPELECYKILKQQACAKVLQLSKTVKAWIYKNVLHLTRQNLPLKRFLRTPNACIADDAEDFKFYHQKTNFGPVWVCVLVYETVNNRFFHYWLPSFFIGIAQIAAGMVKMIHFSSLKEQLTFVWYHTWPSAPHYFHSFPPREGKVAEKIL